MIWQHPRSRFGATSSCCRAARQVSFSVTTAKGLLRLGLARMTGNPEVGLLERQGLHGLLLPNAAVFTDRILAYVNIRQLSASRESLRRIAFMRSCILVALILVLFLFEWRTAVISLTTIPLSLMTAALVLHWRGATLNTMVIAGLAMRVG